MGSGYVEVFALRKLRNPEAPPGKLAFAVWVSSFFLNHKIPKTLSPCKHRVFLGLGFEQVEGFAFRGLRV